MRGCRRRFQPLLAALPFLLLALGCGGEGEGPADDSSAGSQAFAEIALAEDLREEASAVLIRVLEEGSPGEAQRAALAMGRIQAPGYAEPLVEAASPDRPEEVRGAALFALGQLGLAQGARPMPAAVEAAREATADEDPQIAARGTEALGKLAPEGAAATLVSLAEHSSSAVRREALHGLFRLRFVPTWRGQADEPPPLPEDAVGALVAGLGDEATEVRRAAAHAFSRYGDPAAEEALARALKDQDQWVRLFAARGLGKGSTGDAPPAETTLDALAEAAGDPSERVRTEAVLSLGRLGAADRIPAGSAEDDSFHVRAAVATAWAADGTEASGGSEGGSGGVLETLFQDPSPTVRSAAVDALARRKGAAALPRLKEALAADSWPLRAAAARALQHLGEGGRDAILQALEDPDPRVQAAALDALGALPESSTSTETIARYLTSEDLALRGTAAALLPGRGHPQLLSWLQEAYDSSPGVDWVEVRESIVDAAGQLTGQPEGATELLRRIAAEDPAVSVRQKARAALQGEGEEGAASLSSAEAPALEPSPFLGQAPASNPTVVIETSKGTLSLEVFADRAPVHAASFLKLVSEGFYDGLLWHRVVPNFVIQGGDPLGSGWGGPGYALRDEIHPLPYRRGSVGMPKAGKDTGGCQIFITHVPTPHLDGNYTIFAEVREGLDVIDRIEVGDAIVRASIAP